MPDVIINKKRFYNPADYVLKKIGGTWKMPVLYRLQNEPKRYTELHKDIPHISQKMLTSALKELEADGFLRKQVYHEVPLHTDYSLTDKGKAAVQVIKVIREFGIALLKDDGVDYDMVIQRDGNTKRNTEISAK